MMLKSNKGFTLIELLIVIVIIGILAVAVLSAINPIEQINKASDSGKKSNSAELLNALERYYTTYTKYPWPTSPSTTGLGTEPGLAGTATTVTVQDTSSVNQAWLGTKSDAGTVSSLVGSQELKPDFAGRKDLRDLKVYRYGNQSNLVRICFLPKSVNFTQLALFKNGAEDASCASSHVGCEICVPE